jgi:hypothetical protein
MRALFAFALWVVAGPAFAQAGFTQCAREAGVQLDATGLRSIGGHGERTHEAFNRCMDEAADALEEAWRQSEFFLQQIAEAAIPRKPA